MKKSTSWTMWVSHSRLDGRCVLASVEWNEETHATTVCSIWVDSTVSSVCFFVWLHRREDASAKQPGVRNSHRSTRRSNSSSLARYFVLCTMKRSTSWTMWISQSRLDGRCVLAYVESNRETHTSYGTVDHEQTEVAFNPNRSYGAEHHELLEVAFTWIGAHGIGHQKQLEFDFSSNRAHCTGHKKQLKRALFQNESRVLGIGILNSWK